MNILVVNQPLNNRGDQSAHRAFIHKLIEKLQNANLKMVFLNRKDEDVEAIKVEDAQVSYINIKGNKHGLYRLIRFSLHYSILEVCKIHPVLREYLKLVRNADAIICCPGGICMGGFMDWFHVWSLYAGMKSNKPIYYFGRSVGPFSEIDNSHIEFKNISYELIKYFEYISLRDKISFDLVKSIRDDCDRTIDSAFLEIPVIQLPNKIKDEIIGDQYIVFVPNELIWHYKYKNISEEKLRDFYIKLMGELSKIFNECKIVMLPQLYNQTINDVLYFERLKKDSGMENIVVLDDIYNSDIQQQIIRGATFVVGGRYHSIVFSINNGIPFYSLSYEHKMTGLLDALGLNEYQIDFEKVVQQLDDDSIERIINGIISVQRSKEKILKSAEIAHELADNAFDNMIIKLECKVGKK